MEERSFIPTKQYISWFRSIWSDIPGASTKRLAQMPLFDEAIVSFDERH